MARRGPSWAWTESRDKTGQWGREGPASASPLTGKGKAVRKANVWRWTTWGSARENGDTDCRATLCSRAWQGRKRAEGRERRADQSEAAAKESSAGAGAKQTGGLRKGEGEGWLLVCVRVYVSHDGCRRPSLIFRTALYYTSLGLGLDPTPVRSGQVRSGRLAQVRNSQAQGRKALEGPTGSHLFVLVRRSVK